MDETKENFAQQMVEHMKEQFDVDETEAKKMVKRYIEDIQTTDVVVQQLGPDYFAIQILMAEKIIPYKPM